MIKQKKKLLIVGSGITGLSAALVAIKKNINVEIFEMNPNLHMDEVIAIAQMAQNSQNPS